MNIYLSKKLWVEKRDTCVIWPWLEIFDVSAGNISGAGPSILPFLPIASLQIGAYWCQASTKLGVEEIDDRKRGLRGNRVGRGLKKSARKVTKQRTSTCLIIKKSAIVVNTKQLDHYFATKEDRTLSVIREIRRLCLFLRVWQCRLVPCLCMSKGFSILAR